MIINNLNIEEYFQKYKDNIFAIGFNYFKNPADADDVVQETFVKLLRCGKNFESEAHVRNWLILVAINECKRVTLSTWFKKKVNIDDYAQSLYFEEPEESSLFEAVMKLPKKYRQVLHLYYYEDYSIHEISEMLGVSETAVSTQLLRGRQKIKKKMLEVWKDE